MHFERTQETLGDSMTFEDLIEEVRQIKSDHKKIAETDFFETVIDWKELEELTSILKRYFGPPMKPADALPTSEMRKITSSYGGIRANQTLYYLEDGKAFNLAMLWPWGDGMLLSVKLIRGIGNLKDQNERQGFWETIKNIFR